MLRLSLLVTIVLACLAGEGYGSAHTESIAIRRIVIVLPDQPNAVEQWAGRDMQEYLQKISRSDVRLTSNSKLKLVGDDFPIYIGLTWQGKVLYNNMGNPGPDEFFMQGGTSAGQIVIVGLDTPHNPYSKVYIQRNKPTSLEGIDSRSSLGTCRGVWYLLRKYGGVRWYLSTEIGEEVPQSKHLTLPTKIRLRKSPNFNVRDICGQLKKCTKDFTKWYFRVGFGAAGHYVHTGHSYHKIAPAAIAAGRDDLFGMFDGKRRVRAKYPVDLCHNNPDLPAFWVDKRLIPKIREKIRQPGCSFPVMPKDGYYARGVCSCPLCIADRKLALKREAAGGMPFHSQNYTSHVVWPLVVKIAELVRSRAPEHYVTCCSYAGYGMPPEEPKIFPDNVGVQICKERQMYMDKGTRKADRNRIAEWSKRLPSSNLSVWEYYLFHSWGNPIPLISPRNIAEDIKFMTGKVKGERIEIQSLFNLAMIPNGHIGMDGLNVYVTARFMEGAEQNIDEMLAEYYERFYGPAAKTMKIFYEDLEEKWKSSNPQLGRQTSKYSLKFARLCLSRLHKARKQVPADSKYAKRIDMLIHDYQPWLTLVEQKTAPPTYRCAKAVTGPKMDGVLDDPCWKQAQSMPFFLTCGYKERGGFPDTLGSTCRIVRVEDALYFAARIGTDADPEKKAEKFELIFCSPKAERYVLSVSPGAKVVGEIFLAEGTGKKRWAVKGIQFAEKRNKGEWIIEGNIPLKSLEMSANDAQWKLNAKIVINHRKKIHSPLILAKPVGLLRRNILTWQPEAKGVDYDPKYYGKLQFQ